MKVVLLAAGSSKRVKPIADKNFVKVCGKFLIQWQIEGLVSAGFRDFLIVGNEGNLGALRELRLLGSLGEVKMEFVEQEDMEGGMAAAVLAANEKLKMKNEKMDIFMVVSTNDIVDPILWYEVRKAIALNSADSFVVGYRVQRYFPGGYLKVGSNELIEGIEEKPGEGDEPSDLVNLVVHVHREGGRLMEEIQKIKDERVKSKNGMDDIYEAALDNLFKVGIPYRVIPYVGYWQAVKYPWHVLRLTEYFLDKLERSISDKALLAPTAVVNGNVVIEEGVKIYDHAVINGPAYIGKGSTVGNFALVRGSSLGERCVVGSFTEICRSVLGDDVWTHKNYIGDSVVGNNVSFGSGTVTGNLRLDEEEIFMDVKGEKVGSRSNKLGLICGDDVRVGINTSFMPGVRVGENSMIGAGLTIAEDVPEGSYVVRREVRDESRESGFRGGIDVRENKKKITKREVKLV